MSSAAKAHAVVAAGAGSVTAGVFGMAGWPLAALVGGGFAILYGFLFVDVDEKPKAKP